MSDLTGCQEHDAAPEAETHPDKEEDGGAVNCLLRTGGHDRFEGVGDEGLDQRPTSRRCLLRLFFL